MASDNDTRPKKGKDYFIPQEYNPYKWAWQVYTGTGIAKNGSMLVPHSNEKTVTFNGRKALYRLFPFYTSIIDAMYSDIFTDEVKRKINDSEITDPIISAFILDADGKGTKLTEVVKQQVIRTLAMGMTLIEVENHEQTGRSLAETISGRFFPYVKTYNPWQIFGADSSADDMQQVATTDVYGNPDYIPIIVTISDIDYIYRYYSDRLEICDIGNAKVLQVVEFAIADPFFVQSWDGTTYQDVPWSVPPFAELADLTVTYANVRSRYDKVMGDQGFSLFYAQTEDETLSIATDRFVRLSDNCRISPDYVSPNPAITAGYRDDMQLIREEIYRLAEQQGVTGVSNQSGLAKEWDFQGQSSIMKNVSKLAKAIDEKIMSRVFAYLNMSDVYTAEYKTDFAPSADVDTVTMCTDVANSATSPDVKAELIATASMIAIGGTEDDKQRFFDMEKESQSMGIENNDTEDGN